MIQLQIVPSDTGIAELIAGLEMVSTKYLPNTVRAVKVATGILEYTWKAYAMGAVIPGTNVRVKSVRGAYARSIHHTSDRLSGTVWSDSPYAVSLEEGSPERDLKKILPLSPKARWGKNGPYLVVPFRHGAPGALQSPMPQLVYNQILQKIKQGEFQKSRVVRKTVIEDFFSGQKRIFRTYKWGSRFHAPPQFPNLEGMVVFNVPSGERESRGQYMTFRVVSLNKPKVSKAQKGWEGSWVVPARQGYHLTRYVVANTKEIIGEAIRAGITMDLLP